MKYIDDLSRRRNAPRLAIFEKIDKIIMEKPIEIWDEVPTDSSKTLTIISTEQKSVNAKGICRYKLLGC